MEQYIQAKRASTLFNISVATINLWSKKGVLVSPKKDENGINVYRLKDVQSIIDEKAKKKTHCRACQKILNENNAYKSKNNCNGYICTICKKELDKETSAKRRLETPELMREAIKKSKEKTKQNVFAHYGNGKIECCKCGFNDIRALSIDHIDGGGTKHRHEIGGGGGQIYNWIKKNNYPLEFQVLCMNCNFIKRYENNECNQKTVSK